MRPITGAAVAALALVVAAWGPVSGAFLFPDLNRRLGRPKEEAKRAKAARAQREKGFGFETGQGGVEKSDREVI